MTSAGALLRDVQLATGMTGATAGLLTSLPPVCFGAAGLLAGRLGRRLGTGAAMVLAMGVLAAALVARALTGTPWWFVLLTVPALVAMGVGNVLLPVAVKRWFPTRVGRLTGLYSLGLAVGTAGAAAASVPVAEALGSWRAGLAIWALPALLAAGPWWWLGRHSAWRPGGATATGTEPNREHQALRGEGAEEGGREGEATDGDAGTTAAWPRLKPVHHDPRAWALAAFFGLQGLGAYTAMGWLPSIYQDAGLSPARAGVMLAVTMGVGAPVSLLLPELASRWADQRAWPVGLAAAAALAYGGLLVAPTAFPLGWAVLLGVGMGAFPLALLLIGLRALTDEGTARLSALTQTVGYLLAAAGPVTIGVLRDATGDWTVPLLVLLGLLVPQLLCGVVAGRAGHVDVHADPSGR